MNPDESRREAGALDLSSTYLRLRPDATIEPLQANDTFWQRLASGELGSFHHEYLVTTHEFAVDWPMWEMHPKGDEVVILLSGAAELILEEPEGNRNVPLASPGSMAFVPRGTWHTARVQEPSRMLFITAGEGTEHRSL